MNIWGKGKFLKFKDNVDANSRNNCQLKKFNI